MMGGLKKKINRGFKSRITSIPAPIGGLNARDSIANMPETDAIILDNWFPSPTNVAVRKGAVLQNSHNSGVVETLMAYNGAVTKKLFGASNAYIQDFTSSSSGVVAETLPPLTSARFQYTNMATAGGQFLLAVNGSDKLVGYNGTSWWQDGDGTHDITGVNTALLIHVNIFKNRVWFTERESTRAWYLGVNSIGGAATAYDVGPLLRLGGYLMGIVTWTINDASGTQEYLTFVSSEGEALVYQGYDPTYSSTFSLAAHFRIGRPIGRRFFAKVGSDIVLLTADGAIPLSKSLLTDRSSVQIAITDKITNSVSDDTTNYSENFGWQIILYPMGNKFIINMPKVENTITYQYVMNTITGAWCTFNKIIRGWDSVCFEIFNDGLYFSGTINGLQAVYQAETGTSDASTNITATIKPAFSYFGKKGIQKLFSMIKPYFFTQGVISALIGLNVDFEDVNPTSLIVTSSTNSTSPWDTSLWNVSYWSTPASISRIWQSVTGLGVSATVKIIVAVKQSVSLQAIDYTHQDGGYL